MRRVCRVTHSYPSIWHIHIFLFFDGGKKQCTLPICMGNNSRGGRKIGENSGTVANRCRYIYVRRLSIALSKGNLYLFRILIKWSTHPGSLFSIYSPPFAYCDFSTEGGDKCKCAFLLIAAHKKGYIHIHTS